MQVPVNYDQLEIHVLGSSDIDPLIKIAQEKGGYVDYGYYENALVRQASGEVEIYVANWDKIPIGYCFLNWRPKYPYFKVHSIPEIQDLIVLRPYRGRGIGRKIIEFCETSARNKRAPEIGIGVGLDNSFGPAQRLYIKMGYIPDGQGVNYDRKQVNIGEFKPIDENLCLMMTKELIY